MNASGKNTLCIGLSPALQRTLTLDRLNVGTVNRAKKQILTPGGKACNAARTLACLERNPIILGFNGGSPGRELKQQFDALNIEHDFVEIQEPTRTCTTLIDAQSKTITELVEEAPWPDDNAIAKLFDSIKRHSASASAAIIAGALPPGADANIYADMVKLLREHSVPVFIDTSGEPFLRACKKAPLFVKMNHDEQIKTEDTDEKSFAARVLADGVAALLITNGRKSASLYSGQGHSTLTPPVIEEINNLGSGDATLAGTVHAWLDHGDIHDAVRFGMACGTANACTHHPGEINVDQARKFYTMMSAK